MTSSAAAAMVARGPCSPAVIVICKGTVTLAGDATALSPPGPAPPGPAPPGPAPPGPAPPGTALPGTAPPGPAPPGPGPPGMWPPPDGAVPGRLQLSA